MHNPLIQNSLDIELPIIDRADGVWLYDTAGKDYIDGCSGAVVVNLGHSHPRILDAIRQQSSQVTFVHRGAFASEKMHSLAARLSVATGLAAAWFVNSGSEAVEASIQFALQYHAEKGRKRSTFLSHCRSYHGNTLGALSLSGHARREVLGDLAYRFNVLPNPYDGTVPDTLLKQVRVELENDPHGVAGIVVEPLSGATLGGNPLPDGYLLGLRELADEFDTLLITDEVMTGLGRTGSMLASSHWNVTPDLVALGKGLGAGYTPIAATLVSDRVLDTIAEGSRRIRGGHTYGGNPLSVAVADEVLTLTLELDLAKASREKGKALVSALRRLSQRHPLVRNIRGIGLMQGIDIHLPGDDGDEQRGLGEKLQVAALRNGLLIYPSTGGFNDACLIAPPLTIAESELDSLIQRLDLALTEVEREVFACPQ